MPDLWGVGRTLFRGAAESIWLLKPNPAAAAAVRPRNRRLFRRLLELAFVVGEERFDSVFIRHLISGPMVLAKISPAD